MAEPTESRRDSWLPIRSSTFKWVVGLLGPALVLAAIAWGALNARADEDAARLERHAQRLTKVAAEVVERHEAVSARQGSLEARQAELSAEYDALKEGQNEIKRSLWRLEDRLGTRRGD